MQSQEAHIAIKSREIVDKTLSKNLHEKLDGLDNFLENYEEVVTNYNKRVRGMKKKGGSLPVVLETLSLRQNIYDLFEKNRVSTNPRSFDEEMRSFQKSFTDYIANLSPDSIVEQSPDLFSLKIKRQGGMQLLIAIKRIFWWLSTIPLRFVNLGRQMFRKKPKPIKYWRHRIPWKRMTELHFQNNFGIDMLPIYEQFYKLQSQVLLGLSEIGSQVDQDFLVPEEVKKETEVESDIPQGKEDGNDSTPMSNDNAEETGEPEVQTIEKIEMAVEQKESEFHQIKVQHQPIIHELRKAVEEFRNTLPEKINHRFEKSDDEFSGNVGLVGTIELPPFYYRPNVIKSRQDAFEREYNRLSNIWSPTLASIWDTKLYTLEIKMLRYFATKEYFRIERSYRQRINSNIIGELDKLNNFILDAKNRISSYKGDEDGFRKLLIEEKINVKKTLTNELTPKTVEFILNQELPNLLHQSEQALKRRVDQLAQNRFICPEEHEAIPIAKAEKVNLRQMAAFEALPQYSKGSKEIRTKIFEDLNKIQGYIIDINQIVDFTLESSLDAGNNAEEGDENPKLIAEQGLERALNRTRDVHNELHDIFGEIDKNLKSKVLKFNADLTHLLDIKNISKIRSRINKAMALSSAEEWRKNVGRLIMNLGPILLSTAVSLFKSTKERVDEILQHYGLAESPEVISTEIADFLAATKSAVSKLPFVYQRLFKLEPLKDDHFYVSREEEIEEITRGFENWKLGHYAATVVVGERGSGVTTLIQHFLDSIKGIKVIRGEIHDNCHTPEGFQIILNEILLKPDLANAKETIEYLNNLDSPCVIVLEDLQHLFLKIVDGFNAMSVLVEIISKTNGKVFWLMSCTSQAWDFLCKAIKVNEYLAYVIEMKELRDEDIIETILKRHRVSGYGEIYLASEKVKNTKRYRRVPAPEQQEFLKNEYFSRLSDFAKSNISLAILFWLRSTQQVEGNTIHIGIDEPDFGFLNNLSPAKLFVIYLILLHNGLSENDLATIQNIPVTRARLELINLRDDGILIKESENYEINMLLYRPLLRLLRTRNIIH